MRSIGNPGLASLRRCAVVVALLTILVSAAVPMSPGRADAACASGLFGATGSGGVNGNLYCIDPTTGVGTLVGPLLDASANPYGITGLAFQPGTGVLFGSTTTQSPTAPGHLVRIGPGTATVTDVGPFNIGTTSGKPNSMSDITFDPTSGILYGNSGRTGNLYRINVTTGAPTSLGATGQGSTSGGGLASNAAGTIFGTPDGAQDDLFTYNKATGFATAVASLSGAPISDSAIDALAFDGGGRLFGIDKGFGPTVPQTHLVTINTTTGVITDVGTSVDNLDGIAFEVAITPPVPVPAPALSEWGQILMAGLLVATGVWRLRRRRASL